MTYASRLLTVSAANFQSIKFTRETKRRLRSHMQIRIAGTHNRNQEQSTDLQHDAAAALADLDIAHAQGAGVMTTCTNPNSFAADRDAAGTREKNSCFLILIQLQVSLA